MVFNLPAQSHKPLWYDISSISYSTLPKTHPIDLTFKYTCEKKSKKAEPKVKFKHVGLKMPLFYCWFEILIN